MNVRALTDGFMEAVFIVQAALNMPESYGETLLRWALPIGSAAAVAVYRPILGTWTFTLCGLGALFPFSLLSAVALNALGHLTYRTYSVIAFCQRHGASIEPWDHDAPVRCPLGNVFPLFPGNGGLLAHFALSACTLCWWWQYTRRSLNADPSVSSSKF